MNLVFTDYIKKLFGKSAMAPARYLMFGVTGLTMAGLLKLNLSGPGVMET